jgi:iron complex outermembrane recepter protein
MAFSGTYDFDLSGGWKAQLNGGVQYTSSYYASLNLNPTSHQKGYTLINAGGRIVMPDDHWSLALIGRNLSNRRYATVAFDKPGGLGETSTVAGEPRTVVLELAYKF